MACTSIIHGSTLVGIRLTNNPDLLFPPMISIRVVKLFPQFSKEDDILQGTWYNERTIYLAGDQICM